MGKPTRTARRSKTRRQITLDWLRRLRTCSDAVEEYKYRKIKDTSQILRTLIKEEKWEWFSWIAARLMTHKQKVKWAIFCAEQVIAIYEKQYPGDARPRRAIGAAKLWVKHPNIETKSATDNAAQATDNAANAADNADNNAYDDAAYYATRAAYYAARAAYYAARAAYHAAYSAADADNVNNAASDAATAYANAAYAHRRTANAAYKKMRTICTTEAIKILRLV